MTPAGSSNGHTGRNEAQSRPRRCIGQQRARGGLARSRPSRHDTRARLGSRRRSGSLAERADNLHEVIDDLGLAVEIRARGHDPALSNGAAPGPSPRPLVPWHAAPLLSCCIRARPSRRGRVRRRRRRGRISRGGADDGACVRRRSPETRQPLPAPCGLRRGAARGGCPPGSRAARRRGRPSSRSRRPFRDPRGRRSGR